MKWNHDGEAILLTFLLLTIGGSVLKFFESFHAGRRALTDVMFHLLCAVLLSKLLQQRATPRARSGDG